MFTWLIPVSVFILASTKFTASQVAPYALFSTRFGIHRIRLNESSSIENVIVGGHGYGALDYHYGEDLLFWINEARNTIHKARLSDGSSSSTIAQSRNPALVPTGINIPTNSRTSVSIALSTVDIAVDWINNMVYWVDSAECNIYEFHLNTSSTRIVLSTGTRHTSFPRGIAIYPYKNNGWLYWTDLSSRSIEMGSIHGSVRKSIMNPLPCGQALTIDIAGNKMYWADICQYTFQSISLSGNRKTLSYPVSQNLRVFFVSSAVMFQDSLYWVQPWGIFTVKSSGEGYRRVMTARSTRRPVYMRIVHPSLQPPDEDYESMIRDSGVSGLVCDPVCAYGTCIPAGLCACSEGWTGVSCSEDVNECASATHDCEQICTNTKGSYDCSCNTGYTLNDDGQTCDRV